MNCDDAHALLHGYLDAELDLTTTVEYEQHVRDCAGCARILAEQKALLAAMKADALYYQAPQYLHDRVRFAVRRSTGRRGMTWYWLWTGAAACLIVGLGLGLMLARFVGDAPTQHERLIQEVAASHIRSMQVDQSRLVDVSSSDRHQVKPWFNDKLDFAPAVPDLTEHGFILVGGRLDYLDGRSVAALVYKRRLHVINVFVWPNAAHEDEEPRRETRQGYHFIRWSKTGMNYWVVSDLDPTELNAMVQWLRQ